MNYLFNYNKTIQIPRQWGLTIDIGTPNLTSLTFYFFIVTDMRQLGNNPIGIYRSSPVVVIVW